MQRIEPNFTSPIGELAIAAWVSKEFVASLFQQYDQNLRLSIARANASDTPMSWEELMQVKRDCGFGDMDAVEVYPCDKDIFNTCNIRHLYFLGQLPFALRQNSAELQRCNTVE